MKKNMKKGKKNFEKKPKSDFPEISVSDVSSKYLSKRVILNGLIERVVQTGGPTVFEISDGTGIIPLKAFVSAGVRAYEELNEGDYVRVITEIQEYQGEIEGDIKRIFKKEKAAADKIKADIERKLRERARVKETPFAVKGNKILEKLKKEMIKAAEEIRLAVLQSRPIIVRHHNDTDGYCSGYSLERAILPLIMKEHTNPKAAWEYFERAPCMAPYYELTDSIRDTSSSLRNAAKFSNKMPLIIIADNGSTEEDLMAIKQAKIHGAEVIVIDHHKFEKDVISKEVLAHINPFLVEESGSKFSAGMLCVELARLINEDVENIDQISALAGFADRIDYEAPKVMEDYLQIAKKEGYTKDLLGELSLVIEYVSTRLRFMEAREYIQVLFGEPRKQQKELVNLMAPYIRELDKKGLKMGRDNAVVEDLKKLTIQKIFIEETYPGFGFFPKPGRSVGLAHDDLSKSGKKALISLGVMNTGIIFRATDEANFSFHDLKETLVKKLPTAFIEGGGHKNAGTVSFLPKFKEQVLEEVEKYFKSL